jgi:hypothetical protein
LLEKRLERSPSLTFGETSSDKKPNPNSCPGLVQLAAPILKRERIKTRIASKVSRNLQPVQPMLIIDRLPENVVQFLHVNNSVKIIYKTPALPSTKTSSSGISESGYGSAPDELAIPAPLSKLCKFRRFFWLIECNS